MFRRFDEAREKSHGVLAAAAPRPVSFVTPPESRLTAILVRQLVARELQRPLRIDLPLDHDPPLLVFGVVHDEEREVVRQAFLEADLGAGIAARVEIAGIE